VSFSKNRNIHQSRRKLLGALSAGAVLTKLPNLWSQPVVGAVMLPAHAKGTQPPCTGAELVIASTGATGGGDFTVVLVGTANLPSGAYSANFTYPGGTTVVSLDTHGPGTYAATMNPAATFAYTLCPGSAPIGVSFYPIGTPGYVVCNVSTTLLCTVPDGP